MNEWRQRLVAAWPKVVGLVVFAAVLGVQGTALATLAGDDSVYNAVGWAVAHGHLVYPYLPGQPPAASVGPAYPALLSVVWHAWPSFPANRALATLVDAACFGGAAAIFAAGLSRSGVGRLTRYAAIPAAFLLFPLLAQAGARHALPLCLVFAAAAIAVVQPAPTIKRAIVSGVLAGLAAMTLDAGFGLILGLGFVRASRDRRAAAVLVAVAGITVAPWLIWRIHAAASASFVEDALSPAWTAPGAAATTLCGAGPLGMATIVSLVALSVIGWRRFLKHAPFFAAGLGGASLASLFDPRAGQTVWMTLPLIVVGVSAAADYESSRRWFTRPLAITAVLVAAVLAVREVEALRGGGPVSAPALSSSHASVLLTSFLVEQPPGAVIATTNGARFFLFTGRNAVPALAEDESPTGAVLTRRYCDAGVALIAVPDSSSSAGTAVRALRRDQPETITELYQVTRGPSLYRFTCPR